MRARRAAAIGRLSAGQDKVHQPLEKERFLGVESQNFSCYSLLKHTTRAADEGWLSAGQYKSISRRKRDISKARHASGS